MTEYVALQPISHGGALAYQPGDPVPAANVEANGYTDEQVAERDSDQGRARLVELGMLPGVDEPGTAPEAADETGGLAGEYDPATHTVDEVNAHLAGNPGDITAVLRAERDGKGRAGVLHGPHGAPPDVAEA